MPTATPRLHVIDLARSLALAGMVVFHIGFDLQMFGHLEPGTMTSGLWFWWARAVAGSFLFLAGAGLWLAHGGGLRWQAFLRRLAMIAAAALAVSIGIRLALGDWLVRFGILHCIAASSLLGLAFLRRPAVLTLAVAALAIAAPHLWRDVVFNHPALVWVGLHTEVPPMVDYEPLLPWLGAFLLGLATARLADGAGGLTWLARVRVPLWATWPGRHSLLIYLVHQPVLFAIILGYTWITA